MSYQKFLKLMFLALSMASAGLPSELKAQTTSIKDIPLSDETTISVKRGGGKNCEKIYEIIDGTGQVEGEPNVLLKEARANWKKACNDWKKDIRDLNTDNKVVALDCGKVECENKGTEGNVCSSQGTYKIKTKMN